MEKNSPDKHTKHTLSILYRAYVETDTSHNVFIVSCGTRSKRIEINTWFNWNDTNKKIKEIAYVNIPLSLSLKCLKMVVAEKKNTHRIYAITIKF